MISNYTDIEMLSILEELIEKDITITAREIARRHSAFNHAASITRNSNRQQLLHEFQEKQTLVRKLTDSAKRIAKSALITDLAEKERKIAMLEEQVQFLTASHIAMLRAVGQIGGMEIWRSFFKDFSKLQTLLKDLKLKKPETWDGFIESAKNIEDFDDFMNDRDGFPPQSRNLF